MTVKIYFNNIISLWDKSNSFSFILQTTCCIYYSSMALQEKSPATGLTCLQSRPFRSESENFMIFDPGGNCSIAFTN